MRLQKIKLTAEDSSILVIVRTRLCGYSFAIGHLNNAIDHTKRDRQPEEHQAHSEQHQHPPHARTYSVLACARPRSTDYPSTAQAPTTNNDRDTIKLFSVEERVD